MITIKAAFTDRDTTLGLLGRAGENGTRQIEFDCSEILTEYPAAVIVCAVKRPGEESAYYADMQAEGALRRLILRDVETEKPGTLKLELSALDGEKQRRTTLYAGAIASGLTRTDEEPSDPEKDLIDYIADAETVKQEASNAAKDALAAAEAAEQAVVEANAAVTSANTAVQQLGDADTAKKAAEAAQTAAEGSATAANASATNAAGSATAAAGSAASASASERNAAGSATAAAGSAASASASERNAAASESAAANSEAAAQASEEAVEGMVQTIAREPTAQQILAVMQQELTLLNQLVENGMGGSGSLNGFSFSRGENDELIISYVNPDDETDTATSTFATKTLANLIAQELASINESLHTIAGMERTAQTEG